MVMERRTAPERLCAAGPLARINLTMKAADDVTELDTKSLVFAAIACENLD